jgi:hypothetical protein
VIFQVFTAVSMKMTVFWGVVPFSLVEIDQHFRGAYCLHDQGGDDGGSKHLWNVSRFLWDYTAAHPRRQSSSTFNLVNNSQKLLHLINKIFEEVHWYKFWMFSITRRNHIHITVLLHEGVGCSFWCCTMVYCTGICSFHTTNII